MKSLSAGGAIAALSSAKLALGAIPSAAALMQGDNNPPGGNGPS